MAVSYSLTTVGTGTIMINGYPFRKNLLYVMLDNNPDVASECIEVRYSAHDLANKPIDEVHYTDISVDGIPCSTYQELIDWLKANI